MYTSDGHDHSKEGTGDVGSAKDGKTRYVDQSVWLRRFVYTGELHSAYGMFTMH